MKENKSNKELKMQYKERKVIGGVFIIRNALKHKSLLDATTDLHGSRNRFEFSQKTGSCFNLKLQKDWTGQGGGEFVFEVLEELEKGETQSDAEFKTDIEQLKEIWLEKLEGESLY